MDRVETAGFRERDDAKSSFDIYREGGTTRPIRLTVLLVIVARRWRSLLDERLRQIGQSAARMEALAAIINSPWPSAQVAISTWCAPQSVNLPPLYSYHQRNW